jgi:penicillin amidase
MQRIATRFTAGINAYIAWMSADPARRPVEFVQFGYMPSTWAPEDVVRIRQHALSRNASSEFLRAYMACHASLKHDAVRQALTPPVAPALPPGVDPCVPVEVLQAYERATQPFVLGAREWGLRGAAPGASAPPVARAADAPAGEGSNAWAVAPSRTATGRPLLASDPHRALTAPSLRYLVHLSAPGLDAIGAGEPMLPGVSLGHNGAVAFGLTIFATDQEDLVVHELHPDRPDVVRDGGAWVPLRSVRETIPVRGREPVAVELLFSRHGPVLHRDRALRRAWVLRSVWSEPGAAPYAGSLALLGARDLDAFRRALPHWGTPSVNLVAADVRGRIGRFTAGFAPMRRGGDGLLPVPADGRHDWGGLLPAARLPFVVDPPEGWLVSANEWNLQGLPRDHPWVAAPPGFEWAPPLRQRRIAEVLSASPKHSLDDAQRLQADLLSDTARRLQAVLRGASLRAADAQAAAALLLGWDARATGESAAAALYGLWWTRHLGAAVKDALLPSSAARLLRAADGEVVLDTLERPEQRLEGANARARRDALLERTLAAAWTEARQRLGSDPAAWRWDRLHHARFTHPLAPAADAALRARIEVGPVAKGGAADSVNVSPADPETLRQLGGASLRLLIDVGGWDGSRAVNAPGQSGDPDGPHHRDLLPLWLRGETFPLPYSRAAVEAAAVRRIDLVPDGAQATAGAGSGAARRSGGTSR